MSLKNPTPKEIKKVCGSCKPEDPEVECNPLCEEAEWKLYKLRQNERFKARKYPEQSEYVKGNKIWLNLPNEQSIVISAQARELLDFNNIDEAKFVQKMRELMTDCFYDLPMESNNKYLWRAERLSVSAMADSWEEPDEDTGKRPQHICIEIKEITGYERPKPSTIEAKEANKP